MAFDKFLDKAKNLANDPKIKDKLNSEKAEKVTDSILDKAAGAAESLTGGKHTEKIQKARDAADKAIGSDRNDSPNQTDAENRNDSNSRNDNPEQGNSANDSDRPENR
ncbi:MAG: antitoxin [Brevibacterium sp.]